MSARFDAAPLARLAGLIQERAGWCILPARLSDLERWIKREARSQAFAKAEAYLDKLLDDPPPEGDLERLVDELAIGETYFFRDRTFFHALEKTILPGLILERMNGSRAISIWSAGCSSGEEAYSIASVIDELLPDRTGWRLQLLASDIKQAALATAGRAKYGKHSFRTVSQTIREKYFIDRGEEGWEVPGPVRRLVSFAKLNLARDVFPAGFDLIVCRNVLMYFSDENAQRIIREFDKSLAPGGWLAVSPGESVLLHGSPFQALAVEGVILYRRRAEAAVPAPKSGRAPLARSKPKATSAGRTPRPEDLKSRARACADRGQLDLALRLCRSALAGDGNDPSTHYLLASILEAWGELEPALEALDKTLAADPEHAMAQLSGGMIARKLARPALASRRLRAALSLVGRRRPSETVPEADGMSAGQLREFIEAMLNGGV